MSQDPASDLESKIEETTWTPLAPHAKRGGLFFVAEEIGIATAGRAIAHDRTSVVEQWVASGLIRRPTDAEREALDAEPEAHSLRFVIVQPYVLVEWTAPRRA